MGWFSSALGTNNAPAPNDFAALGANTQALTSAATNAVDQAQEFRTGQYGSQIQPAVQQQLGTAGTASSQMLGAGSTLLGQGLENKALVSGAFNPLTKQYAAELAGYGNLEDQTRAANQASDAVILNANAGRDAAISKLEGMGVNVGSGSIASAIAEANATTGAQAAAAANNAREAMRATGIQMRGQGLQTGNALQQGATGDITAGGGLTSGAATTAGTGIPQAIASGQYLTSGVGDALQAANIGINAQLGLGGLRSKDWATGLNADAQGSSNIGSLLKYLTSGGTTGTGSPSIASQIGSAIGSGVSNAANWLGDQWNQYTGDSNQMLQNELSGSTNSSYLPPGESGVDTSSSSSFWDPLANEWTSG